MKNSTPFKFFAILFLFVFVTKVNAQISITASDFTALFGLGEKFTTYLDTTTPQINVGAAGQNTWDLTGLVASSEFVTENKDKATSPYASDFPDAQYASNYAGVFSGVYSNIWVYSSVTTDYVTHGTGTVANAASGNLKTVIKFSPAWSHYKLPINYNDEQTYTGTQTIKSTITVPVVGEVVTTIEQNVEVVQHVDGYGVVTFPDGKKLNALRVVEVSTFNNNGQISTSSTIVLITKTGESVSFTPTNQNETTGVIAIENVSWTTGNGTSITAEVPAAPSGLTATPGTTSIELSWNDNSDNETGFSIERTITGGFFALIGNTAADVTTFTDDNAAPGIEYTYRVRAYNNDTLSAYSSEANAMIEIASITAPSGLSATAGETSIDLMWTDNSDNETGFNIERSASGGAFTVIGSAAANATSYIDMDVMAGILYVYRVQAENNDTVSAYSSEANAMIEIASINAPSGLSATVNGTSIDLIWTDNSDNETGFNIERSSGGGAFAVIGSAAANATSYTDSDVMTDVEYTYRIQALSDDTVSEYSATVSATIVSTGISERGNSDGYFLSQNYPNPFYSKTIVSFRIPKNENVTLSVLNLSGKVVRVITSGELQKGEHTFEFNADGLESGTYFFRIVSDNFTAAKSMMIVK